MTATELILLLLEHDLAREVVVCVDNFHVPAEKVEERTNPLGIKQVVIK